MIARDGRNAATERHQIIKSRDKINVILLAVVERITRHFRYDRDSLAFLLIQRSAGNQRDNPKWISLTFPRDLDRSGDISLAALRSRSNPR